MIGVVMVLSIWYPVGQIPFTGDKDSGEAVVVVVVDSAALVVTAAVVAATVVVGTEKSHYTSCRIIHASTAIFLMQFL